MTISVRVTADDLAIENGNIVLITNEEALRQRLRTRLLTFRNEWFLDPDIGVPYYDSVFVKNPELGALTSAFSAVILGTVGITSLTDIQFDLVASTRELTLTFTCVGDGIVLEEVLSL